MNKYVLLILCCITTMACNAVSRDRSELNTRILKRQEKANRFPDDSQLQNELAEHLLIAGDFESAMRITDALITENNDPGPELLIRSAQLKYLTGDYEAAEQQLLSAKEIARNSSLLITIDFYLSFIYYQTDRYSEAKRLFTGSTELSAAQRTMLGNSLDIWELMCAFEKNPTVWFGKTEKEWLCRSFKKKLGNCLPSD